MLPTGVRFVGLVPHCRNHTCLYVAMFFYRHLLCVTVLVRSQHLRVATPLPACHHRCCWAAHKFSRRTYAGFLHLPAPRSHAPVLYSGAWFTVVVHARYTTCSFATPRRPPALYRCLRCTPPAAFTLPPPPRFSPHRFLRYILRRHRSAGFPATTACLPATACCGCLPLRTAPAACAPPPACHLHLLLPLHCCLLPGTVHTCCSFSHYCLHTHCHLHVFL